MQNIHVHVFVERSRGISEEKAKSKFSRLFLYPTGSCATTVDAMEIPLEIKNCRSKKRNRTRKIKVEFG